MRWQEGKGNKTGRGKEQAALWELGLSPVGFPLQVLWNPSAELFYLKGEEARVFIHYIPLVTGGGPPRGALTPWPLRLATWQD